MGVLSEASRRSGEGEDRKRDRSGGRRLGARRPYPRPRAAVSRPCPGRVPGDIEGESVAAQRLPSARAARVAPIGRIGAGSFAYSASWRSPVTTITSRPGAVSRFRARGLPPARPEHHVPERGKTSESKE